MDLVEHEIKYIADVAFTHIRPALHELVRSIIREELKMTDQALADLTAATNNVVTEITALISEVQSEGNALAAALASGASANDPAIEAQVTRLTTAANAAAAALAALQPPVESGGSSPALAAVPATNAGGGLTA